MKKITESFSDKVKVDCLLIYYMCKYYIQFNFNLVKSVKFL